MENVTTRLRRRIDRLNDELDQANAKIARLEARGKPKGREKIRTCAYCGRAISPRSRACTLHAGLMADDPFYAA